MQPSGRLRGLSRLHSASTEAKGTYAARLSRRCCSETSRPLGSVGSLITARVGCWEGVVNHVGEGAEIGLCDTLGGETQGIQVVFADACLPEGCVRLGLLVLVKQRGLHVCIIHLTVQSH